jgi:hypothetical protein
MEIVPLKNNYDPPHPKSFPPKDNSALREEEDARQKIIDRSTDRKTPAKK